MNPYKNPDETIREIIITTTITTYLLVKYIDTNWHILMKDQHY